MMIVSKVSNMASFPKNYCVINVLLYLIFSPLAKMGNSETNLHDVEVNLTKEQQNFTCMVFICVDFIKLPLKDVLANEIPPEDLYDKIQCSSLKTKLRSVQKQICFIPKPNNPDYCDFDVSLLYTLLRNLGSASLAPTRGWGIDKPTQSETQIGDDIVRFRNLRNEIAHAKSALICDDEFNRMWENLTVIVRRIQTFIDCPARYEKQLSDIKGRIFGIATMMSYKSKLEVQMAFSGELEKKGIFKELL